MVKLVLPTLKQKYSRDEFCENTLLYETLGSSLDVGESSYCREWPCANGKTVFLDRPFLGR
jgi:hypothetical protein